MSYIISITKGELGILFLTVNWNQGNWYFISTFRYYRLNTSDISESNSVGSTMTWMDFIDIPSVKWAVFLNEI
jgi:hypothetical protein